MTTFIGLLLRLPPDLHAALKEAAQKDVRSMHGQIMFLLRQALILQALSGPDHLTNCSISKSGSSSESVV